MSKTIQSLLHFFKSVKKRAGFEKLALFFWT